MILLSPLEDFVLKTLATLSGSCSKLAYIGSLRKNDHYEHWGLTRTYGAPAAGAAISEAHTQVWLEVLRTPLRKLAEEPACVITAEEELKREAEGRAALTPANPGGGSKRHFNSILLALSLLSRKAKQDHPPAA
jgi:hypothetical protein